MGLRNGTEAGKAWQWAGRAAVFACLPLQVTLLTPIYLLANQPAEYAAHFAGICARGALVSAVFALASTAISFALPAAAVRVLLKGVLGVALLIALEGSWLYYLSPFSELDGTPIRWTEMKALAALDLGILAALAWLYLRLLRTRADAVLLIAPWFIVVMAGAQAAPKVIENWSRIGPAARLSYESFFEFSPDRNVFFYLADTISADGAEAALAADPELASQFEGFVFYRDTLSAENTVQATYAILTGRILHPSRVHDMRRYRMDIAEQGFPRHLSSAGYSLSYVATAISHCAGLYTLCATRNITGASPKSLLFQGYEAYRDYLLLVDVALFRHVPLFARGFLYDGGNWAVSRHLGSAIAPMGIGVVLQEVIDNLAVVDGPPRFKWYHSRGAHPPSIYRGDCTRNASVDRSLEGYREQIHCVLREYAAFIQTLKDHDLYDSTALFFVSDHGLGMSHSKGLHFPAADPSIPWVKNPALTESAADRFRPMMLIKPFGSRSALSFSDSQLHQTSLPASVLSLAGIEALYPEPAISETREDADRRRSFTREVQGKNGRHQKYIVTGPSNDYDSYREVTFQ